MGPRASQDIWETRQISYPYHEFKCSHYTDGTVPASLCIYCPAHSLVTIE